MHENEISREIVDAAYKIHRRIGPGLFESVYERRPAISSSSVAGSSWSSPSIRSRSSTNPFSIDEAFRADLIVQRKVIVELKSVGSHRADPQEATC